LSADYEKIRDENIARYGWDTAVLDLLGQLYSERTHFIFELIQNAEDAGATELTFDLFEDRLEVKHDGRPFTEADVRGICGVGKSGKSGDLTKIGKFGIGFKSVYAYTKNPRVYSSDEHFRIESYVRPFSADPLDEPVPGTLFVFPFDHDTVSAAMAVAEISSALTGIEPATLLFLRNIECVRIRGTGIAGSALERTTVSRTSSSRHVTLAKGGGRGEEWFVWHRQLEELGHPALRVEIAFLAAPRTANAGSLSVMTPRWWCSSLRRRRPFSAS
jgi:Molecular chaperone, HSP90 family